MSSPDTAPDAPPLKPRNPLIAIASTRLPFLDSIWASRIFTVIQTIAFPLALWSKPIIVLCAIIWLAYRAYEVLNKPLEELAGVLSFDIPSTPVIDIASIKADGATVHWSLPEKQKHKSTFKFEIQLNGSAVQSLPIHETAATITGLHPNSFYVVRVSLINSVDFSSRSDPIRFRTRPASSGDYFHITADGHDTDHDVTQEPVPRVRAFRGLKDITPAIPNTPPLLRENSTGMVRKRSIRRPSPAAVNSDFGEDSESAEGAETIQHLTAKLNAIRQETDEAERLAKEEDEDETRQKTELTKERDELRAEAAEKEKASRYLKKEVSALERQNTAAQNERTKQERILQQKKQERQRLQDDMVRWEREAREMKDSLGDIQTKKIEYLEEMESKKEEMRTRQTEEAAATKALDDEVKEKNSEIRRLERSFRNSSPTAGAEPETNLVQQFQHDAEETRRWDIQNQHMQSQYVLAVQKLEQAKRMYTEQNAYLDTIRQRRQQEEAARFASPPSTQERIPRRGDSQRSRRAQSGHSSSDSPRLASFPISSSVFGPSMTSTVNVFGPTPFINIHNGMTISSNEVSISDEDKEKLTGGAPMSPGAGADLLPADLFGEGENKISSAFVPPLPGLGSLPGLPGIPGPSLPTTQEYVGPASPTSGSSRSPSVFASPQASQQNLHIHSPENIIDADRRSIRSTRSNRATSGSGAGSRFSGMFGIKQRKVPLEDDSLSLGKTQSHSMPRQDQGIPGLDSTTRKRNSSISGTNFSFSSDGVFDAPPQTAPASRRSRAFNFFSREKNDGWPSSFSRRPVSPRPGSTHSSELPRPSADSSRWGVDTWPSNDGASGARSSPLAFGAGWNVPSGPSPRLHGSRYPSRRPSQQYGNSGPPEDILEDEDPDIVDPYEPPPQFGAIGTKPPTGSKKAGKAAEIDQPKLNPNAKDFKSFFSSMKLSGKKDGTSSAQGSMAGTPNPDRGEFEESPPNSRKSKDTRDGRSMTTTESSIAESSTNLARTPSYSNSDIAAPSPLLGGSSVGKESFMQKLTRKSSSSKFSLPYLKREKSKLDTNSTPPTSARTFEDEEDAMSASVGSLHRESREVQRNSGRNWSNVLKLGSSKNSKKGNETPSISGMSFASTEDGDEEEV